MDIKNIFRVFSRIGSIIVGWCFFSLGLLDSWYSLCHARTVHSRVVYADVKTVILGQYKSKNHLEVFIILL